MCLCINSFVWLFIWCLLMYSCINLYIWVVVLSGQTRQLRHEELRITGSCGGASQKLTKFRTFFFFSIPLDGSRRCTAWRNRGRSQESGTSVQFILVLINKHYLKHLSGPVKYPPCGSVDSPTQGIEYLIIVLTE